LAAGILKINHRGKPCTEGFGYNVRTPTAFWIRQWGPCPTLPLLTIARQTQYQKVRARVSAEARTQNMGARRTRERWKEGTVAS
jgi:hypothetical protein